MEEEKIKRVIECFIEELNKENYSICKLSPIRKTEILLSSYKSYKVAISLNKSTTETRIILKCIDDILEIIKCEKDPYAGLIEMLYIDKKTREECAEWFGVEPSTIGRNRKRLIKRISDVLFSDDTVKEFYGVL